jgi:hypothetical protein
MGMGSSQKIESKILGLVSVKEAERLLFDWANLKESDLEKFVSRYRYVFSGLPKVSLFAYQELLREAWDAPNSRDRSWYLFMLRHSYAFEMRRRNVEGFSNSDLLGPMTPERQLALKQLMKAPPEISPIEATLYYLQEGVGDRAKHCGYEGCRNPYFIAEKRWQKYCSEECAAPANRDAKRKWWHENKGKGSL